MGIFRIRKFFRVRAASRRLAGRADSSAYGDPLIIAADHRRALKALGDLQRASRPKRQASCSRWSSTSRLWAMGMMAMLGGTGIATQAAAYDWSLTAKVTQIELTYMPTQVPFKIDTAAGSCAAGGFLIWNAKGADASTKAANTQAILAGLMTAKASGQTITLFGNNSGCTVDFLYFG